MREGCTNTDFNPCNMPPPPGGYADLQFDPFVFLIMSGVLAVPMLVWALAMAAVSSRKYNRTHPKSFTVEALLPPTAMAAFYVIFVFLDSGVERGLDHLFSKDRWLLELPLIAALYATSVAAVILYCRLRKGPSPSASPGQ